MNFSGHSLYTWLIMMIKKILMKKWTKIMLTDIASYGLINPVPAVVEEVIYMGYAYIYVAKISHSGGW